jgi:hypothetical protein
MTLQAVALACPTFATILDGHFATIATTASPAGPSCG